MQVHHAVEQGEDGDRDEAEADDVEPAARSADRLAPGSTDGQVTLRHRDGEHAERRHDEEDRAPAERLDEDAADARPERRREDDAEAEDAHRLAALAGAEGVQDDDRRDRLQHAGSEALDHARAEDELEPRAEAADDAAGHERDDRAGVAVAVAVAREQPRRRQHRQRHRAHEAGREPLRSLVAERKDAAHVGDGDVDLQVC